MVRQRKQLRSDIGRWIVTGGFHVMATPTKHASETVTGLGATGVQIMLAHAGDHPLQPHPMIPLLQVSSDPDASDMDRILDPADPNPADTASDLIDQILKVASRDETPSLVGQGYTDFQLTRGLTGISL